MAGEFGEKHTVVSSKLPETRLGGVFPEKININSVKPRREAEKFFGYHLTVDPAALNVVHAVTVSKRVAVGEPMFSIAFFSAAERKGGGYEPGVGGIEDLKNHTLMGKGIEIAFGGTNNYRLSVFGENRKDDKSFILGKDGIRGDKKNIESINHLLLPLAEILGRLKLPNKKSGGFGVMERTALKLMLPELKERLIRAMPDFREGKE
ncbi:MAG: hypothetical protein V1835_04545 [Candidatus Micrarchaeota archaeon]